MDATKPEILSHIQDRQDRYMLSELLKKYEFYRFVCWPSRPGLESDRREIESLNKRLAQWEVWYEATHEANASNHH